MAETAPEAVAEDKDSINGVQQLSQEATLINQSFSQQARMWRADNVFVDIVFLRLSVNMSC